MHPHETATSAPSHDLSASPAPHSGNFTGRNAEATAEFLLRLRSKGVRDLVVLRAMEAVPREIFVPHRYADLAARDVALPIGCGQTMSEPFLVARMLEALAPTPASRVLEIGAGSGYTTALLARLSLEALAIERYQSLAMEARTRLETLGIANAAVVWGDGMAVPPTAGPFDRLLVHGIVEELPASLTGCMAEDGVMVYARAASGPGSGQQLVRAVRSDDGTWAESPICPSRLRLLDAGSSQGL